MTRKNSRNETDLPLTISSKDGLVDQVSYFNKTVASKDMSGYYLLKNGEFAYNKSYSVGYDFGSIKRLDRYPMGALSTLYICFALKRHKSDFIKAYFDSLKWYREIYMISAEGARNHGLLNVPTEEFFDTKHFLPENTDEQRKIADFLIALERRIEAQQSLVDNLKKYKRGVIQRAFSGGKGNDKTHYPKWEVSSFGDFFTEQTIKTSNSPDTPLVSLTVEDGITPKTERYYREFLVTKEGDNYNASFRQHTGFGKEKRLKYSCITVRRSGFVKKKNCYIYTRVSTSMQVDGFSLDAQREKLRKYAEFQEFTIAGEYSDEGRSGKSIEGRPQLQEMLSDIAECKDDIEFVLVFKLSHFGRNAADVLNSLQQMQDYGVNLICVEDGIDSSKDSGKLMISVLSAVAEIERENILVQTMEGRKQKAREGKWNGGFAPYGYKLVDGELKIAEDEAEIICVIYDKFIHTTMGAATVAKYLNRQGYVKKKRQNGTLDAFTAHFVKLVLDNPIYCGKIAFGRRKTEKIQGSRNQFHVVKQAEYSVYEGIHEAIIAEEDWLLAQEKRKKTGVKSEKIYSVDHQHLLSGILRCPECGAALYGSVNRKRKKDGSFYRDYWYYACKHRLEYDGHKCSYKK